MDETERISWLNAHCADGGFLQSEGWRAFGEYEGFHTEHFEVEGFWANVIEYRLPLVGKYWYVPRGPVIELPTSDLKGWEKLLGEAKKRNIGWIRVEPGDEEAVKRMREWSEPYGMEKAIHDMQPREIFVVDISPNEGDLLAGMKPKTRYNVRLAEKRGVEVSLARDETSIADFLRMIRSTAARNGIAAHPESHYRALLDAFSHETLELLVARHERGVLAAILVSFFGDTATYLHGASEDTHRELMAPFLLQFRAMQEAKRRGCGRYDLGGVDTDGVRTSLAGVTRFKRGFAESVKTIRSMGSYDIMLVPSRFLLYKAISMSKAFVIRAVRGLTKA